jgi:hypothetical protein
MLFTPGDALEEFLFRLAGKGHGVCLMMSRGSRRRGSNYFAIPVTLAGSS